MKLQRTAVQVALALALSASKVLAQPGGLPAEAAARQAADAELGARVDAEAVARMAADQQLRESVNETSVVGRYAMTGSQSCLNSSTGFNPDFSVRFAPGVTSTVTSNTVYVRGVFTFDADGHGSSDTLATVVNHPGGFNVTTTGGVSVQHLAGTFDWTLADGTLTIFNQTAPGEQVEGPGSSGATGNVLNVQPITGVIGKDAKVITLSTEHLGVETSQRFLNGALIGSTDRVCGRVRVLTKMTD